MVGPKKKVNHWSWNKSSGYKNQQSAVLRFSFPAELLWKSSTPASWSWLHPQGPHDKCRQDLSPPWRSDLARLRWGCALNTLPLPLCSLSHPLFLGCWLVSWVNGHSHARGVFAVQSTYLESGYVQHTHTPKGTLSWVGVVGKRWEVCSRVEGNAGVAQ